MLFSYSGSTVVSLTDRQLNVAVRCIIDRIIFLRMCEGRGIEQYGRLLSLLNGNRGYRRLVELFHRAKDCTHPRCGRCTRVPRLRRLNIRYKRQPAG